MKIDKDASDKGLTFNQAISLGEYSPDILSNYEEWKDLTPYAQLQYITKAMDNRKELLTKQLADLYNVLDFRLKPELKEALANIHKHLKKIEEDREMYYLEYSRKI